jgi:alpha-D-xyloside xylohydrolase
MRIVPLVVLALCACSGKTAETADDAASDDAAIDIAADVSGTTDPCAVDVALANPPTPALATPRWAFEPWISKDISTGDDTRAFVQGFIDRKIPIGVVVLDSPWETNYQTFKANPSRYPELDKLVGEMHGKNVKVVVWLTSLVNDASIDLEPGGDTYDGPSPNFAEGKGCGFFVDGGETYSWWKGTGAGVDFFSPGARTWWNRQQIDLLKLVDGYKLDFGEMYIGQVPMDTAAGKKSLDDYSQAYYREMLAFGVAQKGAGNFLTMVRPWDESYGFAGRFFANKQDAPVAWVGDNRRDWVGLVDALNEMFISAQAGYSVIGSDVGGYLDRDDKDLGTQIPFNAVNFARWIAVGGLGPFMELHGRGNFTPWTVPDHADEITAAYKYWASWHHQFAPMLYSEVRRSQQGQGPVVMQPVGEAKDWPGDWRYILAQRWLVAPLTDATGKREVKLPAGKTWLDWWHLDVAPLPGGATVTVDFSGDLTKAPLYLDACSVQPFVDGNALTGLVPTDIGAHDGWLVAAAMATCKSHVFENLDSAVTATMTPAAGALTIALTNRPQTTIVTVRAAQLPTSVVVDGVDLGSAKTIAGVTTGWQTDASGAIVYIRLPAGGATLIVVK